MIHTVVASMNAAYFIDNWRYCVRERRYIDKDFDCGACTICRLNGAKK